MPDNSLVDYVSNARKQGLTDIVIKQNLINSGWDESTVSESLSQTVAPSLTIPSPPPALSSYASDSLWNWDSFEHILMFLSFYTLIISIGITLYFFIDKTIPVVGSNYGYSYSGDYSEIFLSSVLSAILISLPLFTFFFFNILRRTKKNPALRHILARKRLIYITLIITFVIMMQNLIVTLTSFFNGNLVANSFAHFAVIIGLSLIVFIYYLHLISEDKYAALK